MTGHAYAEINALCATISLHDGEQAAAPAEMILFHHDSRTGPLAALCDARETALLQSGNFDARQKLVTRNLRMVLSSNKGYARHGARIIDLLKAGNRGLVHALENHDPAKDGRLSEYAGRCIRQHIEQALYPASQAASAHKKSLHPEQQLCSSQCA